MLGVAGILVQVPPPPPLLGPVPRVLRCQPAAFVVCLRWGVAGTAAQRMARRAKSVSGAGSPAHKARTWCHPAFLCSWCSLAGLPSSVAVAC